jgi:hypothetical protein
MRDRKMAVALIVLVAFVVLVVLYGGRFEEMLIRMHGGHSGGH